MYRPYGFIVSRRFSGQKTSIFIRYLATLSRNTGSVNGRNSCSTGRHQRNDDRHSLPTTTDCPRTINFPGVSTGRYSSSCKLVGSYIRNNKIDSCSSAIIQQQSLYCGFHQYQVQRYSTRSSDYRYSGNDSCTNAPMATVVSKIPVISSSSLQPLIAVNTKPMNTIMHTTATKPLLDDTPATNTTRYFSSVATLFTCKTSVTSTTTVHSSAMVLGSGIITALFSFWDDCTSYYYTCIQKWPFTTSNWTLSISTSTSPHILAYSPTIAVPPESEQQEQETGEILWDDQYQRRTAIIQRIYDWFKQFCFDCYDLLFILYRMIELMIRFSPLLLLTPASLLYEQYMVLNSNNNVITIDITNTQQQQSVASKSKSLVSDNRNHSSTMSNNWVSDMTWMYIRYAITSLGPAFVKLGQWIATRRDIFPPNICDRLCVLHDKCTTYHPWIYTHETLCNAFGSNYYELGLQINEDSAIIGSGSAAQVYAGTLLIPLEQGNNHAGEVVQQPVAVKILHPNMSERVERDLYFVQTVANWLHTLPIERLRLLNLPRAVSNFGTILLRQADLQFEANHLHQFRTNFYQNNDTNEMNSSIVFPKPYDNWVRKQVLVEDLVSDAIPISEYLLDNSDDGTIKRKELASPLLRAFLKMIFIDNFVHCDLHAGNVLIQTYTIDPSKTTSKSNNISSILSSLYDSARNNISTMFNARPDDYVNNISKNESQITKRKIVFLDAGIAMSLNPNDQRNLHDLFRAVLLNDGNRAGRLMVERAQYERCSQIPGGIDAFASGIEDLVSEFHIRRKDGLTLGTVQIGSLLSRVLDLCRIYGVEIDPNMSTVVISTLVLEGLGRSLDPQLNLIDFAIPFVLGRGRV